MALDDAQLRALSHPLGLRILGIYASDPARSLSPADLMRELGDDVCANVSQVAYHLARLQAVDLVPEPARRGRGAYGGR